VTVTLSSPPNTPAAVLNEPSATLVVTAGTGCHVLFTGGGNASTGAGSQTIHSWVLNVNGNTATLVSAQPFSGTASDNGAPVTFSGHATTGTATLAGNTIGVEWGGDQTGTTAGIPWTGNYTATFSGMKH
jgi:hypothetical protein